MRFEVQEAVLDSVGVDRFCQSFMVDSMIFHGKSSKKGVFFPEKLT